MRPGCLCQFLADLHRHQRRTGRLRQGAGQPAGRDHPLYYFKNDKAAGDIKGQKINAFGGDWYLLNAAGKQIEAKPPAAGASGGA
jgi:hypothetical protein